MRKINRKKNWVWLSVVMGFIFSVSSAYGADLNTTAPQTSEGTLQKTVAPQEASEQEAQSAGSGAAAVIPAGFQLEADNPLSPPDSMPEVSPSPSPTPKPASSPIPGIVGNFNPLSPDPGNQQTSTTPGTIIPPVIIPYKQMPAEPYPGGTVTQTQVTTTLEPAPLPSQNIVNPEIGRPNDEPGVTRNDQGVVIKREIRESWPDGTRKREFTETFDGKGDLTSRLEILYFSDGSIMEYENTTFSGVNDLSGLPQPTYENRVTYYDNGKKQEELITFYERGLTQWEKVLVLEYQYNSAGQLVIQSAHHMEYYDTGELKISSQALSDLDGGYWEYRYEEYSRGNRLIRSITNVNGDVESWVMPGSDLTELLESNGDGGEI